MNCVMGFYAKNKFVHTFISLRIFPFHLNGLDREINELINFIGNGNGHYQYIYDTVLN